MALNPTASNDMDISSGLKTDEVVAVGQAIRAMRQQKSMTLDELSERAGLSPSFMSLVERGRSSLALTSLFAVARALDIDVAQLLPPTEEFHHGHEGCQVVREYAREVTPIHVGDREYRFLAAEIKDRVLEPLLVTVKPTFTDFDSYTHPGEEFAWVISGEIVYVVEGQDYRLGVGDSIHVDSTRSHGLRNETEKDASVLWVLSQPLVQQTLGELTRYHMNRVPNRPVQIDDEVTSNGDAAKQ
jgi:transcriptional regulator with XRE-family HTH domain